MTNRKTKIATYVASMLLAGACGVASKSPTQKGPLETAPVEKPESDLNQYCTPGMRERCHTLSGEIDRLRVQREEAIAAKNRAELAKLNHEMSFRQELLEALRRGLAESDAEVLKLRGEYDALASFLSANTLQPYSPNEKKAVRAVFDDYGPLYIKESEQENGQAVASVAKVDGPMPWTSFWLPKRNTYLFEGDNAPLVKFDKVVGSLGRTGASAKWEKDRYSDSFAEWEGLCDAWALAAIQTKEPPKEGIVFHEVHFSISDLKALTIKMFEGSQPKIYGNRYLGDSSTDGEIQDLRPEAFHRLATTLLGERQQLVAVDDDPGPEVWVKPLFHLRWAVTKDPEHAQAFLVRAWPRLVNNRNQVSDDLTQPTDIKAPVFNYRLYVDPTQSNERGEAKVIYGEWIENSRSAHPDMLFVPHGEPRPANKFLAENADVLRELLVAAGVLKPEQFPGLGAPANLVRENQ